jgi:hypothetical protein
MINKFFISDAKVLDDRAGIVEAYVNTMGVRDADGDIIDPAAFNASIKSNLPIPVLAGHDQSKLVGKVLFAQSEPTGSADEHRLYTRMEILFGRHAESGEWALTSYRMPVEEWTETEARSFCRAHDGILFEPASESMSDDPVGAASDTVMVGLVPLITASDTAGQRLRLARMRLELKTK